MPSVILPNVNDLIRLDPVDRQILEAKIRAERLRRKRRHIEAALTLPDSASWMESNFITGQTDHTKIKLEEFQRRVLRKVFTINPLTGRFPYRTVFYSAPKKSGKSTVGAAAGCYFAQNVEAPNAVYVLANDREQSMGRIFKMMTPTLKALGARTDGKYKFILPNGTEVQANTSDPEKEAGGSYGLTIWDELWAYKSERANLLFDELMPVATRNISMRLIVTYAGFEDSSDLLLKYYLKVFKDTTETELAEGARPVPGLEDITTTDGEGNRIPCCYEVPKLGIFYYNDHDKRMSWQQGERGEALSAETESLLTETNAYRLMHNRWQLTESRLLEPEALARSFLNPPPQSRAMTFAADAGWKHDCSGLVGVYEDGMRYKTGYAKAWKPLPGSPLDLEETLMNEILRLWRAGLILRREMMVGEKKMVDKEHLTCIDVWYDPTQMHQVAMNLRKKHKLLMAEFDQGKPRLLADSFLLQQYNESNIDNIDDDDLQSHLKAARAVNQVSSATDLIRIVKGTGEHAKPIDLAVAQSMAVYRCSKRPRFNALLGIAQGSARGWQK